VGSAQIILFLEMLKFSKKNFLKEILFLRDNEESLKYFGMFYFSNWNLQN